VGQLLRLSRTEVSLAPRAVGPARTGQRSSLPKLGREVELLHSKLQTLKLAHARIEREVERLSDEIRLLLSMSKPNC
jgi:chaperonin cofactor prefoldin